MNGFGTMNGLGYNGNGSNGLRAELEATMAETGLKMKDLTIQAAQRDPYRLDTDANHRDGQWLADHAGRHADDDPDSTIHLRGLHYKIMSSGAVKPNGLPYANTEEDWLWLSEKAAKAARWLGYVSFERIHDARNSEPTVRIFKRPEPYPYIAPGIEIEIPGADDIQPTVGVIDFTGAQPYKIVIFGEKTSLEPVLTPIASSRKADLYLPSGNISDTLLHRIAKTGAEDGRRMIVLTLSDCDPSGWWMPAEIGHKLRAFRDSLYPDLSFEVHRVALTPDQVGVYGLPSTPLKATEKRAGRWMAAMGTEQTEIDALAALQPELLRQIVREAISPFFDTSLDRRVLEARSRWLVEAQARLDEQLDPQELARITAEAEPKLEALRDEIEALTNALQVDADPDTLPEIVIPEAQIDEDAYGLPLVDSEWDFEDHCEELNAVKAYEVTS